MPLLTHPRRVAGLLVLVAASAACGQTTPPVPALPPNPLATPPVGTPPPLLDLGPTTGEATVLPSSTLIDGDDAGFDPPKKRVEFLPTSLLWEPRLADKRDPRLSILTNNVDSFFSNDTQNPSIGLTAGVLRFRPQQFPNIEWQWDLFAVAHLRFSRGDESIAQDYRYGVPITFRSGNVVGKFGYEHTSTQLGDELLVSGKRTRATFERDEVVGALGYLWENRLRVYGQVAYAVYQNIPSRPERWRYDTGFDLYKRGSTGLRGQPFVAVHAAFDPAVDYEVAMNYQVGWMWRKNNQRLSQIRVYAEFYDGKSPFGQLFKTREQYAGFGVALDY